MSYRILRLRQLPFPLRLLASFSCPCWSFFLVHVSRIITTMKTTLALLAAVALTACNRAPDSQPVAQAEQTHAAPPAAAVKLPVASISCVTNATSLFLAVTMRGISNDTPAMLEITREQNANEEPKYQARLSWDAMDPVIRQGDRVAIKARAVEYTPRVSWVMARKGKQTAYLPLTVNFAAFWRDCPVVKVSFGETNLFFAGGSRLHDWADMCEAANARYTAFR